MATRKRSRPAASRKAPKVGVDDLFPPPVPFGATHRSFLVEGDVALQAAGRPLQLEQQLRVAASKFQEQPQALRQDRLVESIHEPQQAIRVEVRATADESSEYLLQPSAELRAIGAVQECPFELCDLDDVVLCGASVFFAKELARGEDDEAYLSLPEVQGLCCFVTATKTVRTGCWSIRWKSIPV